MSVDVLNEFKVVYYMKLFVLIFFIQLTALSKNIVLFHFVAFERSLKMLILIVCR